MTSTKCYLCEQLNILQEKHKAIKEERDRHKAVSKAALLQESEARKSVLRMKAELLRATVEVTRLKEINTELLAQVRFMRRVDRGVTEEELVAYVAKLRGSGLTHQAIADRLGWERSRLSKFMGQHGMAGPKRRKVRHRGQNDSNNRRVSAG
jgi:hypothetical protein